MKNNSKGALPKTTSATSKSKLSVDDLHSSSSNFSNVNSDSASNCDENINNNNSIKRKKINCGGDEDKNSEYSTDDDSKFDLKPKPKLPCLHEKDTEKADGLTESYSGRMRNQQDVNVMYKNQQQEENSLSVLFIGSKLRIKEYKKQNE